MSDEKTQPSAEETFNEETTSERSMEETSLFNTATDSASSVTEPDGETSESETLAAETVNADDLEQDVSAAASAKESTTDEPATAAEATYANEVADVADPAAHDDIQLDDVEADAQEADEEEQGDPYGGHSHERLQRILEAALFASGATLSVGHLRDMFEAHERPHGRIVRQIMAELMAFYEQRGVQLIEVASGYRFQTQSETAEWISRLWEEKPQRYSRALMETIALIAYRQPITRGEIEDVRGVAVSSNIIRTLLEREWVRVVGHRDVPGRPAMYATTRQFLDYFGLKSLDQLPSLSEIRDMDELDPQMSLEDGENETKKDDVQAEITFSGMIEKLRETQAEGKTGSEFIDEQLDDELAAMDEVNANFESVLEQQRADREHPDLDLDGDDEDETEASVETTSASTEQEQPANGIADELPSFTEENEAQAEPQPEPETAELSEEEQWKIIQEKLAQQQALLEARESDQPGEENENE